MQLNLREEPRLVVGKPFLGLTPAPSYLPHPSQPPHVLRSTWRPTHPPSSTTSHPTHSRTWIPSEPRIIWIYLTQHMGGGTRPSPRTSHSIHLPPEIRPISTTCGDVYMKLCKWWDELSTSTGFTNISELSTCRTNQATPTSPAKALRSSMSLRGNFTANS